MTEDQKRKLLHEVRTMFGRPLYADKLGRPISLMEWCQLSEDLDYKVVGRNDIVQTSLCEPSYLSTVWLGIDHAFWPQGPPLLFETMRFTNRSRPLEAFGHIRTVHTPLEFPDPDDPTERTEQVRWSTEEQARLGHARIMRLIQEKEMQ